MASEQSQQFNLQLNGLIQNLFDSAPDCWPQINGAVNAIRIAATRAVTFCWDIETQREQTIRSLTGQLDGTLARLYTAQQRLTAVQSQLNTAQQRLTTCSQQNGRLQQELQISESQRGQCVDAYARASVALQSCSQEVNDCSRRLNEWRAEFPGMGPIKAGNTLRQIQAQVENFPQVIKQIEVQKDNFWKAEKKRQEAGLENQVKELTRERDTYRSELVAADSAIALLQKEIARLQGDNRTLVTQNNELRSANGALVVENDRLKQQLQACKKELAAIIVLYEKCQENISGYITIINQLRTTINKQEVVIVNITNDYNQCKQQYNIVFVNLTQCKKTLTQCEKQKCSPCTESACRTIDGTPGVCTGLCVKPKRRVA